LQWSPGRAFIVVTVGNAAGQNRSDVVMDIILTRSTAPRKDDRLVIFNIEGRTGSVQFFKTLFNKDAVPATLKLTGDFAAPKVKETPEERKARLKALPKPTPAERLAKMEERLARMRAKLAKGDVPRRNRRTARRPPGRRTHGRRGGGRRNVKDRDR
jgi:hypothetical protein